MWSMAPRRTVTKALVVFVAAALMAVACSPSGRAGVQPVSTTPISGSVASAPVTVAPRASTTTSSVPPGVLLTRALDALLLNTNSCLLVTDGVTGAPVYNHQADVAFTPASSQKLFVAAAALDRLGPSYRFATTVVATRPPVAGVVDDLWMVGGGDPLLATPEYATALHASRVTSTYPITPVASLADQVAAAGVRQVRNGIHGDDSRYEQLRYLPTWGPSINHGEFDVGPLSALEMDQGLDSWRPAVPTQDPPAHSAAVLARLLADRKVAAGPSGDQVAPTDGVVLASISSAPLSEIIGAMLRASDNQIAELLVRELDRRARGSGSSVGGILQVMADVARLGLPVLGLSLVDGSGLSHANRATCRALLGALNLGDQPKFSSLSAGLPVAGVSGSMIDFLSGTPVAGRLAAKGGYISGVTALVGRLSGPNPRRFALVANGAFSYTEGLGLLEEVVRALAA